MSEAAMKKRANYRDAMPNEPDCESCRYSRVADGRKVRRCRLLGNRVKDGKTCDHWKAGG